MNNKKWLLISIVFFLTFLTSNICSAQYDVESLRGIKEVNVLIEKILPPLEGKLTVEKIKVDVELKLRLAGIKVVSEEELKNTPGFPFLHVHIMGHSGYSNVTRGLIGFNITVKLVQVVYLKRDPTISTVAFTYGTAPCGGVVGEMQIEFLRNTIKDMIDIFINDYLSVNPKGGK